MEWLFKTHTRFLKKIKATNLDNELEKLFGIENKILNTIVKFCYVSL